MSSHHGMHHVINIIKACIIKSDYTADCASQRVLWESINKINQCMYHTCCSHTIVNTSTHHGLSMLLYTSLFVYLYTYIIVYNTCLVVHLYTYQLSYISLFITLIHTFKLRPQGQAKTAENKSDHDCVLVLLKTPRHACKKGRLFTLES